MSRSLTFVLGAAGALILLSALAACHKEENAASQAIRPVRTATVELQEGGEHVSLTGEIQPRYQADLGFRVNGKIIDRPVDVGTQVKIGDLLAHLDSQHHRQDLEVAKSEIAVAEAEATRSQAQEYRQRELLKNGHTTQVAYDQALKTFKTAQARLESARARQVQASENLGYNELKADNDGVITRSGRIRVRWSTYRKQVIKQADVVLAMFLLGDAFSPDAKKRNFEFYDPLTTGDSSLSPCVEAIIAAQIGDVEKAIRYGMAALLMDLVDVGGNVKDGCHIASMGGTWMMLAYGLGGMRGDDGMLSFWPRSAGGQRYPSVSADVPRPEAGSRNRSGEGGIRAA